MFLKNLIFWGLLVTSVCISENPKTDGSVIRPAEKKTENHAVFTGEELKLKNRLDTLFELSKKVNSSLPNEKKNARKEIEISMDWERVAEICLGKKQWNRQSVASRNRFRELLKEVIVRSAYGRLDKFWKDAIYRFEPFKIQNNSTMVLAKFLVESSTLELEYYLHRVQGQWKIFDIAYEGERYSVNIQKQLEEFLAEFSFKELLGKLKKRRDELAEEDSKKTTG